MIAAIMVGCEIVVSLYYYMTYEINIDIKKLPDNTKLFAIESAMRNIMFGWEEFLCWPLLPFFAILLADNVLFLFLPSSTLDMKSTKSVFLWREG
jgi:hypothetical protein